LTVTTRRLEKPSARQPQGEELTRRPAHPHHSPPQTP
jgi:hypothetical protein